MKAEEKKILYNLIKTSSQYINGYTPEFFKGEEPVFTDDMAEEQKVISDIQTAEKKRYIYRRNCFQDFTLY